MVDVDTTVTPTTGTPTVGTFATTTTGPAGVRLRPLERSADGAALFALDQTVFAFDPGDSDGSDALDAAEWGRWHGAVTEAGELVGSYGTYTFRLGVPGATVPAGGLTSVGVHPDHRRRGLLTAMMGAQLAEVAGRGECVSILFAAEPAIYGRFGYRLASRHQKFTLARRAALRPVPGVDGVRLQVLTVDADAHADLVGDLHTAAWAGRPGAVPRRAGPPWLRIVDLPAALAGRRYAADIDTVLEVRDEGLPANTGRGRLVGGPDGASCERAGGAEPDLVLDVRDLGAAYLGGVSLAALAGAGLVTQVRPGAVTRVAAAFAATLEPFCSWGF